jgi:hypothetical protein
MEVYQALQRKTDGRWDYTLSNSYGARAVGYCSNDGDASAGFHADGHSTAAEAEACFHRYEVERHAKVYDAKDEQKRCAVCGEWTLGRVMVGVFHRVYVLCANHQTREHIAAQHHAVVAE